MKIKLALLALLLTLTGCSSNEATSEVVSTVEVDESINKAEYKDISTTCGLYYKEFLKFGGMTSDEISAENPDWVFTATETKESWDYDGGSALMLSYWRESTEDISHYTRTFPINTANISSWVDVEVVGIDNLLGTIHDRSAMDGATWYYTWESDLENCTLQVYSTGEYGRYTGLVSFTRSGPTAFSQLPNGGEPEVTTE